MTNADEQALFDRFLAGDQEALAGLLRSWQQRTYNVCLRMVNNRDDAAELTRKSLLQIIQNIDDFPSKSALDTWVIRIAMNQSISHLRKRKIRRSPNLDNCAKTNSDETRKGENNAVRAQVEDDREPGPLQQIQDKKRINQLRTAVSNLEEPFRAVLVLRDLQQMDYEKIAEILDLKVETVKSRLFRARLAFRKQLVRFNPPAEQDELG